MRRTAPDAMGTSLAICASNCCIYVRYLLSVYEKDADPHLLVVLEDAAGDHHLLSWRVDVSIPKDSDLFGMIVRVTHESKSVLMLFIYVCPNFVFLSCECTIDNSLQQIS